ncbi:hypothetical protein Q8A73_021018 [Channa argus]|nr:hypothetical protein Q8A73_021018 [Channa argus]
MNAPEVYSRLYMLLTFRFRDANLPVADMASSTAGVRNTGSQGSLLCFFSSLTTACFVNQKLEADLIYYGAGFLLTGQTRHSTDKGELGESGREHGWMDGWMDGWTQRVSDRLAELFVVATLLGVTLTQTEVEGPWHVTHGL